MAVWWESGLSIVLYPSHKESLEQFTGRMPIMLRALADASQMSPNEGIHGAGFESEVIEKEKGKGKQSRREHITIAEPGSNNLR